jgi:CO/xanthine dehydrogenase Mo-binding subunit
VRRLIAIALGIPEHQIRIIQPYVGGGFGGKAYPHRHLPISALLSQKAGRPVKIVYTREEDFASGCPRMPEIIDLRMGFKTDGTIVAKSSTITADAGAYTGVCPNVLNVSSIRPDCVYRMRNVKLAANVVYTNKIPMGPMRGYGNPETLFATESMIDIAAEKLGIDPMELRLKNCSQKGDVTVHGWILNSCGLGESIKVAAEKSGWKDKRKTNTRNRGIGMACQVHVSGSRAVQVLYEGSAATVNLDQYGKVKVISGESEIGQGSDTIFCQIAAEELGVDVRDVEVMPVDTDYSPFCYGTSASRVSTLGGNAVRAATRDVKEQLLTHAARQLGVYSGELEIKNGKFYKKGSAEVLATVSDIAHETVLKKLGGVPITGRGEYLVPDHVVAPDKETKYGNYSVAYAFGTQIAEVSVDPETGKVDVLSFWVGHDIGKALNPRLCQGQIEGGVVQGIGYALSENYLWQEGRILNPNFTDYKIPLCGGTPRIHSIFVETDDPEGPFGAKSIGEPAINPTAPAIANAIYNAIGVRINDLPITPAKILKALSQQKNQ